MDFSDISHSEVSSFVVCCIPCFNFLDWHPGQAMRIGTVIIHFNNLGSNLIAPPMWDEIHPGNVINTADDNTKAC